MFLGLTVAFPVGSLNTFHSIWEDRSKGLSYFNHLGERRFQMAHAYNAYYGSNQVTSKETPTFSGRFVPVLYGNSINSINPTDLGKDAQCRVTTEIEGVPSTEFYNNSIAWAFAWHYYLDNCVTYGVNDGWTRLQEWAEDSGIKAIYMWNWYNMAGATWSRNYKPWQKNTWTVPVFVGQGLSNVLGFAYGDYPAAAIYNFTLHCNLSYSGYSSLQKFTYHPVNFLWNSCLVPFLAMFWLFKALKTIKTIIAGNKSKIFSAAVLALSCECCSLTINIIMKVAGIPGENNWGVGMKDVSQFGPLPDIFQGPSIILQLFLWIETSAVVKPDPKKLLIAKCICVFLNSSWVLFTALDFQYITPTHDHPDFGKIFSSYVYAQAFFMILYIVLPGRVLIKLKKIAKSGGSSDFFCEAGY